MNPRRARALGTTALSLSFSSACGNGANSGQSPSAAPIPQTTATASSTSYFDGAPPPAAITLLAGEVHLHQFPLGGHAWAAFIDPPLPLSGVHGDSVTEIDTAPTLVDEACTLFVAPHCNPNCAGATYCSAPNTCAPLPTWTYIDAGEVDVTGSSLLPRIRLSADATGTYVADPMPGKIQLYAGGELLTIGDTTATLAFSEQLPAPVPVAVTTPDLTAPLHVPSSGPLAFAWVTQHTDEMVVRVYVSSATAGSAYIRCDTTDTGALTVGADLIAMLPPPPRTTRVEVERVEQRIVPTATPGVGVLVHAAQTSWENGSD